MTMLFALVVGLAGSGVRLADGRKEARAIINAAIEAAGGRNALAKYRQAFWYECEVASSPVPGLVVKETETVIKLLPGQMRLTTKSESGKRRPTVVWVVDGEQGWLTNTSQVKMAMPPPKRIAAPTPPGARPLPPSRLAKRGTPPIKPANTVEEMTTEALTGCRDRLYAQWVSTLLPLDEEAFELRLLDDATVDRTQASAIEIKRTGRGDVRLYFDKGTTTLVRMDWGQIEQHFSEPAEHDGLIYPTKVTDYLNGKMLRESRLTKLEFLDSVDDGTFEKP